MKAAKIIRCKKCGTILVTIVEVAFSAGSHVVIDCEMKCRSKRCKKQEPVSFDIEAEDLGADFPQEQRIKVVHN